MNNTLNYHSPLIQEIQTGAQLPLCVSSDGTLKDMGNNTIYQEDFI